MRMKLCATDGSYSGHETRASALHQVTARPPCLLNMSASSCSASIPPHLPLCTIRPALTSLRPLRPHHHRRIAQTAAASRRHTAAGSESKTPTNPPNHTHTHTQLPPSVSLATAQQHHTSCSPSSSSLHPSSG